MRLSRLVSAANWRYALGELVLIVVGVSIALAATSWYEGRQERGDELLVLQQLRQTLGEDLEQINAQWDITKQRVTILTELVAYLESDASYTPDLGVKFQALLGWRIVRIKTAPFEALKVQSYQVISNPTLREMLIAFYEDQYSRLEHNLDLDRDFAVEKVQPYYFANFAMSDGVSSDIDGGTQAWVPRDYEKIKADGEIANLCRFRADLLNRFALQQFEESTNAIRAILDEIDRELGEIV